MTTTWAGRQDLKMAAFSLDSLPCTLVTPKRRSVTSSERFSLLLLEFGEIYFEDFSAICYPNASTEQESIERKQRGRLKVCSKSILFDPLDLADPVIKLAYRDCQRIEPWKAPKGFSSRIGGNTFFVSASQVTEMLQGNTIAPYNIKSKTVFPDHSKSYSQLTNMLIGVNNPGMRLGMEERRLLFSLNYASIDSLLSQILTLHRTTALPKADQNALIDSIVQSRRAEVSFNTSWLEDLYEEIVAEATGEIITPLVSNPGRIMLTSLRLYFQPYNNVEVEPVLKLKLSELKYVMKRRYMLRHVGIELFCGNGQTMFLVLPSVRQRNSLYQQILAQPNVRLEEFDLEATTLKWQTEEMSNYDYLMFLNFLSDRSFNDIMQYPVMPWIIADYTSQTLDLTNPGTFRDLSKPVGALNEERLMFFKERYSEMAGRYKFLYGTHYSAPGYILYFLVRAAPEYLLCLQNGKFDQPNRLFNSITKTWENVRTDHADVKELIPEFYQPPGDFLRNVLNLDLGVRTDGVRVSDVVMPPWAKDVEDFTRQCQAALECDYVSDHLHHWIDLIFGYQQQGMEAVKANNLFHFLTYEGAVNLDRIHDPEELAAIELQIKEFGQTPKQLFTKPHLKKVTKLVGTSWSVMKTHGITTEGLGKIDPDELLDDWVQVELPQERVGSKVEDCSGIQCLKLQYLQKLHKEPVSAVKLSHDGRMFFSASHDKTLKVHSLQDRQLIRSSAVSNLPLSCLAVLPDSKTVLVGSWDNHVYTYSVEFASAVNSTYCHHSSVTSLCWKGNTLATASWDSTVKIWSYVFDPSSHKPEPPELQCELDHDNEVRCMDLDNGVSKVASGTIDGNVTVWSIPDEDRDFELQVHNEAVHALQFNPAGSKLCTCGGDGVVRMLDLASRCEILSKKSPEVFRCMVWNGDYLLFGSESGELLIWEATTFREVARHKAHAGPIISVDVAADGHTVVTGGQDKCIGLWSSASLH